MIREIDLISTAFLEILIDSGLGATFSSSKMIIPRSDNFYAALRQFLLINSLTESIIP